MTKSVVSTFRGKTIGSLWRGYRGKDHVLSTMPKLWCPIEPPGGRIVEWWNLKQQAMCCGDPVQLLPSVLTGHGLPRTGQPMVVYGNS